FVWEAHADEIHEDDAAVALARAAAGSNITFTQPSEGKVTLLSEADGLFTVKRNILAEINTIPDVTIACLPDNYIVKAGGKLAGARIIPLVTKRDHIMKAEALAQDNAPLFEVMPFQKHAAGIIITGSEVYEGRIEDRFEAVIRPKLSAFGADILGTIKCPDDVVAIKNAIDGFVEKGASVIILCGGMSVDPDDCTPSAIRESGAHVVTYGVPAQPGNMLMFAYLNKTALFGVPSAAIHHKTTTLDVFLPRVFAGMTLTKQDFASVGTGGFCLSCSECSYPRCYFCSS
ncbi:MAG: molybdopterin-binding protein, partial [Clostridiales bacterium]|nr:molybdopterin-binding protein [Clostridiales bacterium]